MDTLRYVFFRSAILWLLPILFGPRDCACAQDPYFIRSWSPPPKKYTVPRVDIPSDGTLSSEESIPNLFRYAFRRGIGTRVSLWPMGSLTPRSEEALKDLPRLLRERPRPVEFPDTAEVEGYAVSFEQLKPGDIIPLFGHLFYVAREIELVRLERSHAAYKGLGFPLEATFSFPFYGKTVQEPDKAVSAKDDESSRNLRLRFPDVCCHRFRGHIIFFRRIERVSPDDASARRVELAIVPRMADKGGVHGLGPTESDFKWYSVGDELPIPWAFATRVSNFGKPVEAKTTDPRYYKITNIVPPDSPTIKVQPEDGGEPIECKPIGWVDIDIHGREEPAGKKE